jgi:hypothetical protein
MGNLKKVFVSGLEHARTGEWCPDAEPDISLNMNGNQEQVRFYHAACSRSFSCRSLSLLSRMNCSTIWKVSTLDGSKPFESWRTKSLLVWEVISKSISASPGLESETFYDKKNINNAMMYCRAAHRVVDIEYTVDQR